MSRMMKVGLRAIDESHRDVMHEKQVNPQSQLLQREVKLVKGVWFANFKSENGDMLIPYSCSSLALRQLITCE